MLVIAEIVILILALVVTCESVFLIPFKLSYVHARRLNNNSLTGTCPQSLSNIEGLTLV